MRRGPPHGPLEVLAERHGLVFVAKPAGLQTESDLRTQDSLAARLAAQLGVPPAHLHALSRLDTGVSGVVSFARSPAGLRQALDFRKRGLFVRRYVALASGESTAARGSWSDSIGRAAGTRRRVGGRHAEAAHTEYAVVASSEALAPRVPSRVHLLALAPQTGRTHQLRVHASAHGLPLLGDRAYGGVSRLIDVHGGVTSLDRVALHAAWVELPFTPTLRVEAPLPARLRSLWTEFGGPRDAFERALGVSLPPSRTALDLPML